MDKIIDKILTEVRSPARYIGHEVNAIHKDFDNIKTKFALAFPDVYEIGMSYPGFQILYDLINKEKDALASRVFAPHLDMEKKLIKENIPLFCLEYWKPLKDYDFLGFSLQYEMSFPTILNMMKLANLPLRSLNRSETDPIVIGGGPCAFNPEPIAPFFDIIVLGEAEEVLPLLLKKYQKFQEEGKSKLDYLIKVSSIEGIYVPRFFNFQYNKDQTISSLEVSYGSKKTAWNLSPIKSGQGLPCNI